MPVRFRLLCTAAAAFGCPHPAVVALCLLCSAALCLSLLVYSLLPGKPAMFKEADTLCAAVQYGYTAGTLMVTTAQNAYLQFPTVLPDGTRWGLVGADALYSTSCQPSSSR